MADNGIAFHQSGIVEKVPVGLLPYGILPCVEDGHDPLLHHPLMVAELVARWGESSLPSVSHRVMMRTPSARRVESVG